MSKLGWDTLGQSFDCACGQRHALPIAACYIGAGAGSRLAAFARASNAGAALLISDVNTHPVAGAPLARALHDNGIHVREHVFAAPPEADLATAEQVAAFGEQDAVFIAAGSGTLSDLAKYAGSQQRKPVLLFPTAASMNGYSSAIVALKVRGLKRTLPCAPATGIFADPEVAATAPARMAAAGVADFLSKGSSAADWRAAHLLRGDYYCARPGEFTQGLAEQLLDAGAAVAARGADALTLVLEALLLSGFGMVVAGSSAPASGGEHLISHYLDMKHALYRTPVDLHGAQVGVATIHTLRLWEKVLSLAPEAIDPDALVAAQPSPETIEEWIFEDWGEQVGREVREQWNGKYLEPEALTQEIIRFREVLPRLRQCLEQDLLPAEAVAACVRACNGPADPESLAAPLVEYQRALSRARFLRNRFTILDLAAELNIA